MPSGFADRLIVAHGLESCERPAALFEEIWRVLAPGGKAIFLVPNRAGIWARRDATPFGYGSPYSIGQLERPCSGNKFHRRAQRRGAVHATVAPAVLAEGWPRRSSASASGSMSRGWRAW